MKQSLKWFFTKTDLYRNKTTGCLFEWLAESFIQLIHSKHWFIQEQSMWVSNWSIHLTDELKHSRCFTKKSGRKRATSCSEMHSSGIIFLGGARIKTNWQYCVKTVSYSTYCLLICCIVQTLLLMLNCLNNTVCFITHSAAFVLKTEMILQIMWLNEETICHYISDVWFFPDGLLNKLIKTTTTKKTKQ